MCACCQEIAGRVSFGLSTAMLVMTQLTLQSRVLCFEVPNEIGAKWGSWRHARVCSSNYHILISKSILHSMPPSRSTKDPVRFNPSGGSRPHRARTTQPAKVIDISSDDDDADAKSISQITKESKLTPASRISTLNTHATRKKRAAFPLTGQRPVTVARILAGDFGDPKTWTFGLPEPNLMDIDKLVEETRSLTRDLSEAEWRAAEARLRKISPKVHGVRHFCFLSSRHDSHDYPPTGSSRQE